MSPLASMLARTLTAAAACAWIGNAAGQTVLFTEDFGDATGAPQIPTGDDRSEKWQPTYYFQNPDDDHWVFIDGTFLASSAIDTAGLPAGDKAVLLNESPDHALALRHSVSVAPGTPLTLTFDHWGDNRPDSTNYQFNVFANETLLGTVSRGYTIPGPGAMASFSFLADASGALLLRFADASVGQASGIIDNIVLTAIPEPETYAMILAGLGLLGFVASRRRGTRRFAA